jgi:hypothetical protein
MDEEDWALMLVEAWDTNTLEARVPEWSENIRHLLCDIMRREHDEVCWIPSLKCLALLAPVPTADLNDFAVRIKTALVDDLKDLAGINAYDLRVAVLQLGRTAIDQFDIDHSLFQYTNLAPELVETEV